MPFWTATGTHEILSRSIDVAYVLARSAVSYPAPLLERQWTFVVAWPLGLSIALSEYPLT